MSRKPKPITVSHVKDIAESWASERPDLDPLDYLLPIYLLRVGRIVERMGERRWRELYGLSGNEIRVLFALRRGGGDFSRRPTDLFKALLVTSGAMTKNVARLLAAGLVQRRPDPSDKGGFLVSLTKRGKEVADDALLRLTETSPLAKGRMSLTQRERVSLLKIIEKILLDLEADAEANEVFE